MFGVYFMIQLHKRNKTGENHIFLYLNIRMGEELN